MSLLNQLNCQAEIAALNRLKWVCSKCNCQNYDDIDKELGPFYSLICNDCNAIIEESDFKPEEATNWNNIISRLTGGAK